jgi:hypothetical protein
MTMIADTTVIHAMHVTIVVFCTGQQPSLPAAIC